MIRVGLPAYNESHRIKNLLLDIHRSLQRESAEYEIVVYDDGSRDDTVTQALSMREEGVKIHLIEGKENRGLGYALCYLIDHSARISSPEDTIIIMDADATHNPEHIHRMLGYIKDGFDVVIASRYTPYSRMRGLGLKRRFLSNVANFLLRILFPIKGVSDYSCSYRAYTAKILKLAKAVYKERLIEEKGFACMAELLIKLRRLGIIACGIPLILRYDKKAGETKMDVIRTTLSTISLILKSFFLPGLPAKKLEKLREEYNI